MSAQPTKLKYKRLIFTVGESVTHGKPFSKRFYRFVVCLLTDKLVGSLKFLD